MATRKGRGCTRPDLPPVLWQITRRELLDKPGINGSRPGRALYLGRYPVAEGGEDLIKVHHEEPHETTEDGCPGGWYRTAYCNSLEPYLRRRTDTGGRVDNPRFTSAPWQVQAAAMIVEHEQERWHVNRDRVTHRRWLAGPGKPKKKGR